MTTLEDKIAGLADHGSREGDPPPGIGMLGLVGAGQMGAGIASTAITHGVDVVVRETDDGARARARRYRDAVLERVGDEDATRGGWEDTAEWESLAPVDAAVEAVFELPEVKDEVLQALSTTVSREALLASNTSAIPIHRLARSVHNPSRFLGMHFFSPVERMPLVEVIPHAQTDASTTDRARTIGRQLGKVPVVVGDAPGFFTSRVYARWLIEAIRLLEDGVSVRAVDEAALEVGFPVGPLRAIDHATTELVLQASVHQVVDHVMADRLDVQAVTDALVALQTSGVQGQRHGHGFYLYADGRRQGVNPAVEEVLGKRSTDPTPGSVGERLLMAFATEAWLCSDDGTLCHPDDGDVAAVLGIGFPKALGGPFAWADAQGLGAACSRAEALGPAFPTGPEIAAVAGRGSQLADLPRRTSPFAARQGQTGRWAKH